MTTQDRAREAGALEAAALIQLAAAHIPTDVQELLVRGDPMRNIPPGALTKLIDGVFAMVLEGADERVAEIRKTHDAYEAWRKERHPASFGLYRYQLEIHAQRGALLNHITALSAKLKEVESELTAQKAAHVKMLREEADAYDVKARDGRTGTAMQEVLAKECRRLADKIEGGSE